MPVTVSKRVTQTRMESETGLVAAWGLPNRLAWVQKRSRGSFRSAEVNQGRTGSLDTANSDRMSRREGKARSLGRRLMVAVQGWRLHS